MNGTNKHRERPAFGTKPENEGDVYNIEIEGIGTKGDGIGRVKGFVVIVPGVAKGDKVDVKITAVRGKVAFGEKASGADATNVKTAEAEEPSEDATEEKPEDDADEESSEEETDEDTTEENSDDEPDDETTDDEDESEEK